jgi:hypothetical protein
MSAVRVRLPPEKTPNGKETKNSALRYEKNTQMLGLKESRKNLENCIEVKREKAKSQIEVIKNGNLAG